ncbi:hypothetical protein [Piscinibacter sakaiensis]|uniref:hypothetical protein n=1 Tax=Piscinibacter sakaiensis TaxID=1547922 RepID=UPI003AAD895C
MNIKETMMLKFKACSAVLLAAGLGAALPLPAAAGVTGHIAINIGHPPVEYRPAPRRGAFWAPGHWDWRGGRQVWVPGHWVHARPAPRWVEPAWVSHGGRWILVPGYRDGGPRAARRDFDRDGIPNRYDRDRDNDGIPNRYDRDRDGDGVPNRRDRRPDNPWRH